MQSNYKYIKYKTKYLELKNTKLYDDQLGGKINNKYNFIIIGDTRNYNNKLISKLKSKLKSNLNNNSDVYEYKFIFTKEKFILDDLTFESVASNIKAFIDKKELLNNIIVCLEESSPYGLFFTDTYPDYCKSIICYPLRLNCQDL
jgi:hypothetical protein